jgi:NAD(P)-dependent dehydrogenase (short-subunit alcohol dehydrogenase family)
VDGVRAAVADYPLDDWHRLMNVNLNSVFYCGSLYRRQARAGRADESCRDRICEIRDSGQCCRSRLDRYAPPVGASGGSEHAPDGSAPANGKAWHAGRSCKSRLLPPV